MSPHNIGDERSSPKYHPAKPLPFDILNTILIDIDERLFPSAFNALFILLHAGVAHRPDYALFLPPSQYLALAATAIVHPAITTGPDPAIAALAATYLNDVVELVGPANACLRDAWEFTKAASRNRRGVEDDEDEEDDTTNIKIRMANDGSLFRHAEDLWAVVGWAFNTSVLHPGRWKSWKIFLEVILNALETDWQQIADKGSLQPDDLRRSLLLSFLPGDFVRGMASKRRVIRSVFADGSDPAAKEFIPIWNKELAIKKDNKDMTQKKVDVYNEEYADYLDGDADADFDFSMPKEGTDWEPSSSLPDSSPATDKSDPLAALGGMEAMILRQRFLTLLSSVCYILPSSFMSTSDFYEDLKTHIRPLPPLLFSHMSLATGLLPAGDDCRMECLRTLAATIIQPSAPDSQHEAVSQETMIRCFLPYAANVASAAENAKLGVVIAGMLGVLLSRDMLSFSDELVTAARKGAESREEKGRKGSADEVKSLQESSLRIRAIVKRLKRKS